MATRCESERLSLPRKVSRKLGTFTAPAVGHCSPLSPFITPVLKVSSGQHPRRPPAAHSLRLRGVAPGLKCRRMPYRQPTLQLQPSERRTLPGSRYPVRVLRASPDTHGVPYAALALHRMALRLVPLSGKVALVKHWPSLRLGESEVCDWARRGANFGIITGEPLVILDTDSSEAEAWVKEQGIDSPVVVRSGGGGLHRYFRKPEGTEIRSTSAAHGIRGLDVKGWHSYIVAPGSLHPRTHERYAFLPGRELTELTSLPVFDPAWVTPIRVQPLLKPTIHNIGRRVSGHIRDVRAYVRGIKSVEGHGGDRACFTVACLLAEAGFAFDEALSELLAWNTTNAFPEWKATDLERKLRYAYARVLRV